MQIRIVVLFCALAMSFVAIGAEPSSCRRPCTCGVCGHGSIAVIETPSFRIFACRSIKDVDAISQRLEKYRMGVRSEWLEMTSAEAWTPKCDVFLYRSAKEFRAYTRVDPQSKGFASVEIGEGQVFKRRLDLRVDTPEFLDAVLPHETTHVVLADYFSSRQIPRWADEGIAIATEPVRRLTCLRETVRKGRAAKKLIPLAELLTVADYPADPERAELFFAQSATLVDFFLRHGSPHKLVKMLSQAQVDGYTNAIKRVFRMDGVADLQTRWWASIDTQPPSQTITELAPTGARSHTLFNRFQFQVDRKQWPLGEQFADASGP